MSVENGSDWVERLLWLFEKYVEPGATDEHPIDVFNRNVLVTPHWEEPIGRLVDTMPVEHVVAGSDWPHYDSLAVPSDWARYLSDLNEDTTRKILRDNLRSVLADA